MSELEILAPVGNFEMLDAALAAGAGAIYLGLDNFGARAYAENFTLENIGEIIDYAHLYGRKVYVTINTLIKDSEIKEALTYVEKLYQAGADALLIQDLGLFSLIKDKVSPKMELHASTQMAVRDYYGAKALSDLGFDRVVVARETPLSEIEKMASLPVDLEVFVHGSLCVSVSGECLLSSYYGRRSANRGRCAGSCRKKYGLEGGGKTFKEDYYLSMKDLSTIERLEDLKKSGVKSLKIEGRMKTPEYVYTVVASYKKALAGKKYDGERLSDSSNRGFTQGFIFDQRRDYLAREENQGHRGVGKVEARSGKKFFLASSQISAFSNLEVVTSAGKALPFTPTGSYKKGERVDLLAYPDAQLGSEVLMLNSSALKNDLEEGLKSLGQIPVSMTFVGRKGKSPKLYLKSQGKEVDVSLPIIIEEGKKVFLSEEDIKESLSKTGGTDFKLEKIEVRSEAGIFLKKSDLNLLRREGLEELKEKIVSPYHREALDLKVPVYPERKAGPVEKNAELLDENLSPKDFENYDNIYLRNPDAKASGGNFYFALDPQEDYDFNRLIKDLKEKSFKGVVINSYRDLAFLEDLKKGGLKIRVGRYLNVFNSATLSFYSNFAERACPSPELSFDDINKLRGALPLEVISLGRLELMNMVHCPFSPIKNCGHQGCLSCPFRGGFLINENGDRLPLVRYGTYSKLYSPRPIVANKRKFDGDFSTLDLLLSKEDLTKKDKTFNLNYDRGVI